MLKTGFSILVLLNCLISQAQSDSNNTSLGRHYNLKLSYNNSVIIYPGISVGAEFPLQKLNVHVIKNKKHLRDFTKERFITGNLNWYHHPAFHDNLYITAEWVMRRTNHKCLIWEFSAGPGFSRTFLGGTTYKVDDVGKISVIRLAGYNYALITAGGGFGYDFSMKKQLPVSAFARMNLIFMFPYNSTIYFRPVLELGIRYTPDRYRKKKNEE
jgi:hypothetical protein